MSVIDLRSDTVTKPTPEMRRAMYEAEVGDDVMGDDPTAKRLEQVAAHRLGKEAAVLVTSGTMGNLVCTLTHTQRGDEIIVGSGSHIVLSEVGGHSALGGIQLRTVPDDSGIPSPADVEAAIRDESNIHNPRTRLVCLENTHNRASGVPLTPEEMGGVIGVARRHGLAVHLDGARIFNAAVALGLPAAALANAVDSVTFCLSKGLGCPIGSVVCGSAEFIAGARKYRKMLGGGMRQVGIIAAAGIVALESMVERLAEDHVNARRLAEGLAQIPDIGIDPDRIQTNIAIFDVKGRPAQEVVGRLTEQGILCLATGKQRIRMVTHYHITGKDVERTLRAVSQVMKVASEVKSPHRTGTGLSY